MNIVETTLARIKPVNPELLARAQARLDNKTKPLGSLGRLEEFACRVAAISGSQEPDMSRKVIFTFAGDHGIVEEGVSLFPKEVTPQMVFNFLSGGAGVNVLARHSGAEVRVVDVGVDYDFAGTPGMIHAKVARGTKNFAKGPAMTRDEALAAMTVGIELADRCKQEGVALVGTGEMGIGNTTPSSAIIAAISGLSGAGVDPSRHRHRRCRLGEQDPRHRAGIGAEQARRRRPPGRAGQGGGAGDRRHRRPGAGMRRQFDPGGDRRLHLHRRCPDRI